MGGLTWTKKHVATMADTLDQEYDDLDGAARAALDAALSIIEERAKFAVVGQVYATQEHGKIPPDHPQAVKVCLGLFETDTKANEAAGSLAFSTASGDSLKTWVVPTFFGTPAGWHGEQRKAYAAVETKADTRRREKIQQSIEKHRLDMEQRAADIRAMEAAAGGQGWPCPQVRIKSNECRHNPTCK